MVEDGPERLIPPILWTCRSLAAARYVGRPPLCGRPPAKVGRRPCKGIPRLAPSSPRAGLLRTRVNCSRLAVPAHVGTSCGIQGPVRGSHAPAAGPARCKAGHAGPTAGRPIPPHARPCVDRVRVATGGVWSLPIPPPGDLSLRKGPGHACGCRPKKESWGGGLRSRGSSVRKPTQLRAQAARRRRLAVVGAEATRQVKPLLAGATTGRG